MKANIKLYKTDGITKIGYPIKLIITNKGKKKRKTLAYSFVENWNDVTQKPIETHPNFMELYSYILNIRTRITSIEFMDYDDINLAMDFLLQKEKNTRIDFYEYAAKRVDFMISQGREGNATAYKMSIDQLKKYKKTLYFDEVTKVFLENFKLFKLSETKDLGNGVFKRLVSNSSIRTYLYEIRAIYNSLVRSHEVIDKKPFVGLFLDLKVQKRRKKNIYIDKKGFKLLENVSLKSEAQQLVIDLTLLQFYLGGLDLVDVFYLKNEQFNNGRVYLKRGKLGLRAWEFDVKVFDKAQKIIDKYKVPGIYLFPWRKDRKGYQTFRSNHNRSLKKIIVKLEVNVLPIAAPFTTKAVRHSFATIAKFEMIDVDIIRELMGHERTDIDTIYKDLYPEKVRDKAHFKIIS